jgi:hypothetical protein
MPVELRIAPWWRRVLAALANLLQAAVGGGLAVAGGYLTSGALERLPGDRKHHLPGLRRRLRLDSRLLTVALSVSSLGAAAATRNTRHPSFRLLRLRLVDSRTGGEVSVRSAVVGRLFDTGWRAATRRLLRSRTTTDRKRLEALRSQIEEIAHRHADAPEARARALSDLYDATDVNPSGAFAREVLSTIVSSSIPTLLLWRGRSLREWVTGTVVIVEP